MMQPNTTFPAVAYVRCSGLSQLTGDSFTRQLETIHACALNMGATIVQVFEDAGVSGETDSTERAGFTAMMNYCHLNRITLVIVERDDRIARKLLVSESIVAIAQSAGVRLWDASVNDDLCDSTDPSRVMIRQLRASVAQFNKAELVSKLARARARKRAAGVRCDGRKPFGHSNEIEIRTLGEIRVMNSDGKSLRTIARELNASGAPTRQGKAWNHSSVASIIRRTARGGEATKLCATV